MKPCGSPGEAGQAGDELSVRPSAARRARAGPVAAVRLRAEREARTVAAKADAVPASFEDGLELVKPPQALFEDRGGKELQAFGTEAGGVGLPLDVRKEIGLVLQSLADDVEHRRDLLGIFRLRHDEGVRVEPKRSV